MAKNEDTKTRILDVTEQLCAAYGPRELRHVEIARQVDIKPPSLYSHYAGMDEIKAAVSYRALRAILDTYEGLPVQPSPIASLNCSQSRQIDLMIERPGIARLVLNDLSQPWGSRAISANIDQIEAIVEKEQAFFTAAVAIDAIEPVDFPLWYGSRLGSLYVTLSYEWLTQESLSPQRITEIKNHLSIP